MKLLTISLTVVVVGAVLFFVAAYATGRDQYETAAYEVLQSEGKFELRRYEDLSLVASPMDAGDTQDRDSSFMRLFRYISGENEAESKIAMTTPVFVGEAGDSEKAMSFVMPEKVAEAGTPQPKGKNVFVTQWEGGTYATYKFSGRRNDQREAKALEKLQAWLSEQGVEPAGKPKFAFYDPPWTPGPMRRNEVLIPVDPATVP